MQNELIIAISKAMVAKEVKAARAELVPGEYKVEGTVEIDGTLIVREDTEKTATSSLLSVDFLLLVCRMAGITREAAMKAIEETAGEYLVDWTGSDQDKKNAKAARKAKLDEYDPSGAMKLFFDNFKKDLPKVPVKGSVSFKGEVSEVAVEDDIKVAV